MDCNSIIYDSYHKLQEEYKKDPFDLKTLEERIIQMTIKSIGDYILAVSPSKMAYVAFDGVAPLAKMDQQRTRRYKTEYFKSESEIWNTSNITPGTPFMKKLSNVVNKFFAMKLLSFNNINIITSCSDKFGEGEHKLFQYLRENDCKNDVVSVYGLDADLIMLAILHSHYTKEIYIFREAPNFKTVISGEFKPGQQLFIDIDKLSDAILKELGKYPCVDRPRIMKDYVIMCTLLGNDYMPHTPSLNIRDGGITRVMDAYKKVDGLVDEFGEIDWVCMKKYIEELGKGEEAEMKRLFNKKRRNHNETIEYMEERIGEVYWMDEEYINVNEYGWEERYKRRTQGDSKVYIEGIEWVYKYYTQGSRSVRWRSGEGVLLKGLEVEKPKIEESEGMSMEEQLEYVMPKEREIELEWVYRRYTWECNVKIKE
jgi:5'-3' exonuclease